MVPHRQPQHDSPKHGVWCQVSIFSLRRGWTTWRCDSVFIDFASSRFFHTAPFFTSGAVILGIVRKLRIECLREHTDISHRHQNTARLFSNQEEKSRWTSRKLASKYQWKNVATLTKESNRYWCYNSLLRRSRMKVASCGENPTACKCVNAWAKKSSCTYLSCSCSRCAI